MTPLLHPNLFATEVPGDAIEMEIWQNRLVGYPHAGHSVRKIFMILPPGNWQIVCIYPCTEAEGKKIVKSHYSRQATMNTDLGHYQTSSSRTTYMDYMNGFCTMKTALESLASLFKSNNLSTEKRYVILKNEQ